MSPSDRVAVVGFAALWAGERPPLRELAGDPAVVDAMVAAGRLEHDELGRLVGVHGLSARQTRHRIDHVAGSIHTWCALDAIGIPAALGIDADAITSCPTCDTELRVHLSAGEPEPAGQARLWFPTVDCCEHVMRDFCAHANLYCTHQHLAATVPPVAEGRVVDVTEAAAIGRGLWSDVTRAAASDTNG